MLRLFPLLIAALLISTALMAAEAPALVPGSWTLVILPDTQDYYGSKASIFTSQTQWIRDNALARNIKYVLQEGDITNTNSTAQWEWARTAMGLLDGVVPYAIAPGNHDCLDASLKMTNRVSLLSTYFLSRAQSMPTFGGTFEPNNLNNSYHLFSAGGRDWIVIALEWAPRDAVLTWANGLLDAYPNRTAMIVTHAYLYSDSTRYNWVAKGTTQSWNPHAYNTNGVMTGGVNDGEQIWQKLVKLHENMKFVFNGHVLNGGVGRLNSTGVHGNPVYQILANYQDAIQPTYGAQGYLRLLEFRPDGETVQVYTYSPYLNNCLTDDQQQFVISNEVPLAPSNPSASNKTMSSMRLNWQDNSDNEDGFNIYYDAGSSAPTTLRVTTAANASYCYVSGLLSNRQYSFQVAAAGIGGESVRTPNYSTYTLAGPPSIGNNIVCDKSINQLYPLGTTFTFSNPAGFGTNGAFKVSYFAYVWDTSPMHTWNGTETTWASGTLSMTPGGGNYYLHLCSYNGDTPGQPTWTTLNYGPFRIDGTVPTTTAQPVGGVYDEAVSVSLTADESSVIYYTTDGSEPASGSSVYSSPIPINSDTTLRFYAVDTIGNAESPKKVQTYWRITENGSIAAVKSFGDREEVRLGQKHLYLARSGFGYIQEPDRASGIRIEGNITAGEGSVVSLVGSLARPVGSEYYVQATAVTPSGPANVRPLGANNAFTRWNLMDGLYVTVWGMVSAGSVTGDSFILNDGSGCEGIRINTAGAPGVTEGFVVVTGAAGFDGSRVIYAKTVLQY